MRSLSIELRRWGSLKAEKLAVAILEASALRLPLIPPLLAVVVFYLVEPRVLHPDPATLAVAVFALLDPLIPLGDDEAARP